MSSTEVTLKLSRENVDSILEEIDENQLAVHLRDECEFDLVYKTYKEFIDAINYHDHFDTIGFDELQDMLTNKCEFGTYQDKMNWNDFFNKFDNIPTNDLRDFLDKHDKA